MSSGPDGFPPILVKKVASSLTLSTRLSHPVGHIVSYNSAHRKSNQVGHFRDQVGRASKTNAPITGNSISCVNSVRLWLAREVRKGVLQAKK